jgi:molybdopterin molybdotransferase
MRETCHEIKWGEKNVQFFKVKTVEETYQLINDLVHPISAVEKVPINEALHRILAEGIFSNENVPNFARSTVDGYAVRARDTYGSSESMPGFLTVAGEVKMGEDVTLPLEDGQAISIPTGGMLPSGSDSVIMIEHCENMDGLLNTYRQVAPGENVIGVGEDVEINQCLFKSGTKLRPQELGALASIGITDVLVKKNLRIGYLSSGDEIVPYETKTLQVGQVRDINTLTIAGLTKEWGFEFIDGGIVPDDFEQFKARAKELYEQVDCLIMSGGSSVGAKDYTTDVIQSLGSPGIFVHGISIKPGKPTILSIAEGKPVIGLPGHPASAMIIYHLFGKRILEKLAGANQTHTPDRLFCKITKNIPSAPGRSDYVRVRLYEQHGSWWAEPIIGKSGLINTLVQSDGMIEIDSEKEGVVKGDAVPVILFR